MPSAPHLVSTHLWGPPRPHTRRYPQPFTSSRRGSSPAHTTKASCDDNTHQVAPLPRRPSAGSPTHAPSQRDGGGKMYYDSDIVTGGHLTHRSVASVRVLRRLVVRFGPIM
ncbi:hypothetical protein M404DRAFT_995126 [Pisolithus tinctorius Marx 270]|uniref:Uncharacterized protein n=1 Tax=Pisolithus tinctorius Marx 270 TaxID=870435 RepID=A0A0C3JN58_PISTI|nr:hypothetical protein M404DRAFT_995126 [Pisolithus tinctorius Marx 270]